MIFVLNVPVGIAVAVAALRVIPAAARAKCGRLDAAGALLATASLMALSFALVEAPEAGWGSFRTVAVLASAAAGLAGFVLLEARVNAPLVRPAVFRRRTTATARS